MNWGTCVRCGAVGRVEWDHPDGRWNGRPITPKFVVPLCLPCHHLKGVMDRASGVEAGPPTVRRRLARRAVWLEFLACGGVPILLPWQVLADFAAQQAQVARCVPEDLSWSTEA